jgi:hypothetical protein
MKTAIGSGVGTAARGVSFNPGFVPRAIFLATDSAQYMAYWTEGMWVGRSNTLGSFDSYINGIRIEGTTVYLGTDAKVNGSAVPFYWAAIGEDGSDDFEIARWMGNATAGRTIALQTKKTPFAFLSKRDSTRTGVVKVAGATTTAFLDGTTPSDCITSLGNGVVTVTAANEVNEFNNASGLGEGIEGLALFESQNCQAVTWTNGTSGQVIPCNTDPLFALIFRTDGTGGGAYFVTREMIQPDYAKPVQNTAMATNIVGLQPGGIRLGSASTVRTGVWNALVFGRNENAEKKTPAILIKGKKGVYFPGRSVSAYVNCGNSDATLKISGSVSIEWFGSVWAESSTSTSDLTFITRGVGPFATTLGYSWGLGGLHKPDLSWSGPFVHGITNSIFAHTEPLDACAWRTGVLIPEASPTHYVLTVDGSLCKLYVNGKLTRQRDNVFSPGVVGGTAHYTGFGARPTTGATWTNFQRMIAMGGSVYNRALTADEVVARFEREAYGSKVTDVTSGLAERWDFSSLTSSTLPATVSSTNNGALSGGATVVSL